MGTVAVVTGANRGLGEAITVAMAREGARVVASATDVSSTDGVMRRLQEIGPDCMAAAGDVLLNFEAMLGRFSPAVTVYSIA